MGKVQFGLSDVHYAILKENQNEYETAVALPGAVNLSVDLEGETNKFYADNGAYAVFETNSGYTGELELAMVPEAVYTELLGYIKNASDEIVETTTAKEVHFGLSFRIETNAGTSIAFRYFNCTLSRPSLAHSTTSESTDPTTQKLAINFMPLTLASGVSVVKAHKELSTSEAHTYCSTIALPVVTA